MQMHKLGECPLAYLGHDDCDGVGHLVPNPFAKEIYGDSVPYWQCDAQLYESAMDI